MGKNRLYNLTRNEKEILEKTGLNSKEWLRVKKTEFYLTVQHRETGKQKIVSKFPAKPITR